MPRKRRRAISVRGDTYARLQMYTKDPCNPSGINSISGLIERLVADHLGNRYHPEPEPEPKKESPFVDTPFANAAPPKVEEDASEEESKHVEQDPQLGSYVPPNLML